MTVVMNRNALIIFIKNPEKGKVKTRLAETMGAERALNIYRALLNHTRRITISLNVDRLLFYSAFIDRNDEWSESAFQKFLQKGEDLGMRMHHAFTTALADHEKAVIIGSDCASLTTETIQKAFTQLDQHDFVIGPARDGGYYLLGMKEAHPQLFTGISWSTDSVLPTTIDRIELLGKSYYCLPELSDIDYEEDWKEHGWEIN